MRVLFLVQSVGDSAGRIRVAQYLPHLEKRGWKWEMRPFPRKLQEKGDLFRRAKGFDLVFIQRKLLNPFDIFLLRHRARRIIFDFDDAIMYRDSHSARHFHSVSRRRKFAHMMKSADAVIAGNAYLAELARSWNPRVMALPSCVDLKRHPETREHHDHTPLVLGWIGSRSTMGYLAEMHPYFSRLSKMGGFALRVVSDAFPDLPVPMEKIPWSLEGEVQALMGMDVGLMPMREDVWTQGKCGFKILQYFAVGTPALSSPVGVNSLIVEHGVNGFLASSMDEWVDATLALRNASSRSKMGAAGRAKVEAYYSVEANWHNLSDFIEKVIQSP